MEAVRTAPRPFLTVKEVMILLGCKQLTIYLIRWRNWKVKEIVEKREVEELLGCEITDEQFEQQEEYACENCGSVISEKVYGYSIDKFGRPLCVKCQRGAH